MRTEQLRAILDILEESDQEEVKMYYESPDKESIPVVCTIKNGGVIKDQLISLVFYEEKA